MSVMTLLNLNAVCYTHDVPDDVIRIIIEYVKTHTLKNKFNFKFLKGQQCMIADDIIHHAGLFHTTYQGPYAIMYNWFWYGFGPRTDAEGRQIMVENQMLPDVDWEACNDHMDEFGTHMVNIITDYYETESSKWTNPEVSDSDSDSDED